MPAAMTRRAGFLGGVNRAARLLAQAVQRVKLPQKAHHTAAFSLAPRSRETGRNLCQSPFDGKSMLLQLGTQKLG